MLEYVSLTVFILLVILGMAIDLGAFSKNPMHVLTMKQAVVRTSIWVTLGLLFAVFVYFAHWRTMELDSNWDFSRYKAIYNTNFQVFRDIEQTRSSFSSEITLQYLTGYFVEYTLSIDNLFVILLIFQSFNVKPEYQKRILMYGVIGALILRFVFIFIGGALIAKFHWVLYIFGAILVISGFKLLIKKEGDDKIDTEHHPMVRLARKLFRISKQPADGKFLTKYQGKRMVTSLFVVLLVVEFTDVIFAVDSVPAIFGITQDPYLVFYSNIFAIMGLRSLFFMIGRSMEKLYSLQYGLSIILIFIGVKMIFEEQFDRVGFNNVHNMVVLVGIILISVLFAFIFPRPEHKEDGDLSNDKRKTSKRKK